MTSASCTPSLILPVWKYLCAIFGFICLIPASSFGFNTISNFNQRYRFPNSISPLSFPRSPGTSTSLACGVGFIVNPVLPPSHKILADGLSALGCMEHRGACGGDGVSGDGAGVMTRPPWDIFEREGIVEKGEGDNGSYAVGMTFLPLEDVQSR